MYKGQSYTENELGEKIEKIENEIKSIFRMRHIPLFLVEKSKLLFAKWKLLTNWKEDDTPLYEEILKNK
jgi:hypothetical protein